MDNVTHATIGVGVYATFQTLTPIHDGATTALVLCASAVAGSEWPDMDILFSWFKGPVSYLYQHRQISHSLPLWFLYSLVTAILANWVVAGHFWTYALLSFIGTLTHVGTDMLTTYGTKAFWPFSNKRWRGDTLFTVEPAYIIIFLIAFTCIETGVSYRATVWLADICAILFTVWRVTIRRTLIQSLNSWMWKQPQWQGKGEGGLAHLSVRITPNLIPLPRNYKFVIQDGHRFYFGSFGARGLPALEEVTNSAHDDAVAYALKYSASGKAMQWFAPMLFAEVSEEGTRTIVKLADASVRYTGILPFSGVIDLTKKAPGRFAVVAEGLRAQPIEIHGILKELRRTVGHPTHLHIPSPRGYRSKSKV